MNNLKKEKLKEFDTKLKELQDLTQELLDKKENGESRIVEFGLKEIDDDNIHTIPDWGNIRKFLEDTIDQTRPAAGDILLIERLPDGSTPAYEVWVVQPNDAEHARLLARCTNAVQARGRGGVKRWGLF